MHGKCQGMHAEVQKHSSSEHMPKRCSTGAQSYSAISPELSSSAKEATGTLQALAALSALALPFAGTSTNLDFASSK